MKRGGKMVRTYGLYLVLILCISFFLPRFLPGSPLSVLDEATASQNMEAFPDTFREYYAPEKPESVQFLLYLKHLLCGDLGYSLTGKRKVADMIGESLGYSLLLAGLAMTVSTWIGVCCRQYLSFFLRRACGFCSPTGFPGFRQGERTALGCTHLLRAFFWMCFIIWCFR